MTIGVRYFAVLRDQRGVDREEVEIDEMTAGEFADFLRRTYEFTLPSSLIRVAVDGAFVEDDAMLVEGQEVVLIPPVAGG